MVRPAAGEGLPEMGGECLPEMVLPEKVEVLGVGIHPLKLSETVEVIGDWIGHRHHGAVTRQVVTLNAEMLYRAQGDPELRRVMEEADLVVPDGHGVVWAGRRAGYRVPERVTGIDLIHALAEAGRNRWSFYLLGSLPGVAGEAATNLQRQYPGLIVAGTGHGYFERSETPDVVRRIRDAAPDLLLVALGSPGQELFIHRHRHELGAAVAIGVGGSLDVLAGRLRRAPVLFQRLRLEWLYRLLQEPSRWRRVLVLPRFVWMVLAGGRRI